MDGFLRLDGYGSRAFETFYHTGTPDQDIWIGFRIAPPEGLFATRGVEEAAYDPKLAVSGPSAGTLRETGPGSGILGSWQGLRSACRDGDFAE